MEQASRIRIGWEEIRGRSAKCETQTDPRVIDYRDCEEHGDRGCEREKKRMLGEEERRLAVIRLIFFIFILNTVVYQ